MAAIDWYWYSEHTGCPVYVDWSNICGPPNIFNELFTQKTDPSTLIDTRIVTNCYAHTPDMVNPEMDNLRDMEIPIYKKYEGNFFNRSSVYKEPCFNEIRKKFNKYCFDNISINSKFLEFDIPPNTLGVHCRYIGHYGTDFSFKTMIKNVMPSSEFYKQTANDIRKTFEDGNFEYIYVACHALPYFNILKEEFKDKLIYLDYPRWNSEFDDTKDYSLNEYGIALSDIVNLSKCSKFISSISNFSFMTLIFNPSIDFKLFSIMDNWCGG
jgi:hypothetical protein